MEWLSWWVGEGTEVQALIILYRSFLLVLYSPVSNCRGGQLPIFGFFWLIIENLIQFKLILKGIRHKILLLVSVFHQDKHFKTPFTPLSSLFWK